MKRFLMIIATTFALITTPVFADEVMSTESTTIGDLIDNPASKAVLDEYLPGLADNPQIGMARGMTLRSIAPMAGIEPESMDKIDAALKSLTAAE